MTTSPPLSVVIPTIGRVELLRRCISSLIRCDPSPDEIVVVDQSHGTTVADLAAEFADVVDSGLRVVVCAGRGIARATNLGLRSSRHDTVAITHDDCTVTPDWISEAWRLTRDPSGGITTGRVLPPDGSIYVPSTIVSEERRDYTGTITSGVLYPANMVLSRDAVLGIGGFDERPGLMLAAEDNDLCFRWLAAGRVLRYEPDLVVWHHDWRTPAELIQTHVVYARGQGVFYAKHLYARDRRILPLLRWDLRHGLRSTIVGTLRREPRWKDPYREMVGSLVVGIAQGMSEAWRLDRRHQFSTRR